MCNKTLDERLVGRQPICYPSVVAVEALGYTNILSTEEADIRELLNTLLEIPLDREIINTAIRLRQRKKMSLGDSIVAATALENNCELWTANTEDFAHIEYLRIRNPLEPLSD